MALSVLRAPTCPQDSITSWPSRRSFLPPRGTRCAGKPVTSFMKFGDRIRISMEDAAGQSLFGTIDQVVEQYRG